MTLKPQIYEDDINYIYLPFVKNVVDMNQGSQTAIDAEIAFALNGNWDTDKFGNRTDFWKFFINRYGHYRIMKQFTEEDNGYLVCDHIDFNKGAYPVLIANHDKYVRLADALQTQYDVLAPYNVFEENSYGEKHSKLSTTYGQHTDTGYETSMDSTAQQPSSQMTMGSHTDDVVHENNVGVNFEDNAFESSMSNVSHSKNRKKGNFGNLTYADLIEKEVKLARINFWDIICKDLLDNICLKYFATYN